MKVSSGGGCTIVPEKISAAQITPKMEHHTRERGFHLARFLLHQDQLVINYLINSNRDSTGS
jgi:hypothetical protein